MKITDLTAKADNKPIELISCLQNSPSKVLHDTERVNYFGSGPFPIGENNKEIVRLAKLKLGSVEYDLIAIYFPSSEFPNIYLGHWNSGTVTNENPDFD